MIFLKINNDYWRIYTPDSNNSWAVYEFEFEFWATPTATPTHTPTTTPIPAGAAASSYHSSSDSSKAYDNILTTYWQADFTTPPTLTDDAEWWQYDFGSGNEKAIQEVRMYQLHATNNAESVTIQWSDNGTNFTTVGTFSPLFANNWNTMIIGEQGTHRIWRIATDDSNNSWAVYEFELNEQPATTPTPTNTPVPTHTPTAVPLPLGASASSVHRPWTEASAAYDDDDLNTMWMADVDEYGPYDAEWWLYNFGSGNPKAVRQIRMKQATSAGPDPLTNTAGTVTIHYSNDGNTFISVGTFSELSYGWNDMVIGDHGAHPIWKISTEDSNNWSSNSTSKLEPPPRRIHRLQPIRRLRPIHRLHSQRLFPIPPCLPKVIHLLTNLQRRMMEIPTRIGRPTTVLPMMRNGGRLISVMVLNKQFK